MTSLLSGLLAQDNFIPHGFCLAWDPALVWLHVISDSVIALAYYCGGSGFLDSGIS
jgi:hypothetical protein